MEIYCFAALAALLRGLMVASPCLLPVQVNHFAAIGELNAARYAHDAPLMRES
jgi:hypothetical protein